VTATSPVVIDDIVASFAQHRALKHAPPSEHAWLAARGSRAVYEAGDIVTRLA
jgi:hypothetical protein